MTKIRSLSSPSRTSFRVASTLALAAAACASFAPVASAISMRDDVPNVNSSNTDNPYVAFGASSAFNPIGLLGVGSATTLVGTGTGMLVPSNTPGVFKFLTAAHNVDTVNNTTGATVPDGKPDQTVFDLYFGASVNGTGATGSAATGHVEVNAAAVSISPQWVSGKGSVGPAGSQYDMAVITFTLTALQSGVVPTTTLGFSLASPLGRTGTLVGYGRYGTGNNFGTNGMNSNGVRRAGNNAIDFVATATNPANTGFTLQTDFDSPRDASKSTIGSSSPLTLEATTASGDSGGPLLVQDQSGQYGIVGVLNGGYQGSSSGAASEYGDRSIWASVADADNMAYLLSQGIAVPEPSTYALLALGLTALAAFARRRKIAAAH